ncbi:MAG: FG-GAP-like repeat-containing protein [Chloroflexota bacterium]
MTKKRTTKSVEAGKSVDDKNMTGRSDSSGQGTPGLQRVLVEMVIPTTEAPSFALEMPFGSGIDFQIDSGFEPIPMPPTEDMAAGLESTGEQTVIVRGTIDESQRAELEALPNVVRIWDDTPIAPFEVMVQVMDEMTFVEPMAPMAPCPIGVCDCTPTIPKASMAEVAAYLGVDQIWATGHRGDGIVVAVVDGGITAQGRPIKAADTSHSSWPNKLIPRVIGGWPTADWGTTGVAWGWHGNMCATDVLGIAPNAQLYDIRISNGDAISNALSGFQWAIDRHKADGTPHILTNSWGIFQEAWDSVYANNPNHPFTRKVVEALDEGILVLFAAGNCGNTCPDGRCGSDTGPGKSIWGANSHPRVMTVGAVNKNEQFVGYSSQGPGALDPNKPDFCSVTHFTGFFNSDSGTSAATPIAAGVVALFKQANAGLTQDQAKNALKDTAKDIGPAGWDQHSGSGIIRPKVAYEQIAIQMVVANFAYHAGGWRVDRHPRVLADVTGNGRVDIVGFGNAGVWVSKNNGDGTFQAPQMVVANFGYEAGNWRVERHPRFLADVTGNGRADIVGFGNAGVWVSKNNGDGTFQAPQMVVANFGYEAGGWRVDHHPRFVVDVTGDGRADIVGFGNGGVWVSYNNGDGTFQAPQLVVGNFGYHAGGWRTESHPRLMADVTGNGRADIVGFGDAGVWVSRNNGNGTFQAPQMVVGNFAYNAGGWRVDSHPRLMADVTGNGCADIVGFGDAGVWVSRNNGNGTFQAPQMVVGNFGYSAGGWRLDSHVRLMGEVNGDGRTDIVGFGDHGVWVWKA